MIIFKQFFLTGPLNSTHTGYAHILNPSHTGNSPSILNQFLLITLYIGTSYPLPPSPENVQNQQYYLDSNHVLNTQLLQQQQPYLFPSQFQPQPQPNTFDYYELGFKNSLPISSSPPLALPIQSPNSQRYIVQHNHVNVQPSSTPGGGGSAGNKRPLPFPPIVGEAELFHPRPRMGLGIGGLADGLEDGLNGNGNGGEGRGDESAALETQTQSVCSESGGGKASGDGDEKGFAGSGIPGSGNENQTKAETEIDPDATVKKAGGKQDGAKDPEEKVALAPGEEEPSIQELLLAQSQVQSHTVSGVEAWEMELGETVKRISSSSPGGGGGGGGGDTSSNSIRGISGSKTRTRPKKRDVIMGEIGRKSARAGASVSAGTGLEGGRKRISGVLDLGLFEAPDQVGNAVEDGADSGSVDLKEVTTDSTIPVPDSSDPTSTDSTSTSTLILRESALDERESSIAERESTIIGRESSLDTRESTIAERESIITGRESGITERESSLDIRESSIAERESTITQYECAISADKSEIQQRIIHIQQRELEVDRREFDVQKREQEVSEREIKVGRREEEVKEWYEGKLAEVERVLRVPHVSASTPTPAAKSKWPAFPIEFARRLCATFLLPVLGEERTPGFLLPVNGSNGMVSSPNTTASSSFPPASSPIPRPPTSLHTSSWSLKRDLFLNRVLGSTAGGAGSYLILMSIGICAVVLRRFVRRVLGVAVGR